MPLLRRAFSNHEQETLLFMIGMGFLECLTGGLLVSSSRGFGVTWTHLTRPEPGLSSRVKNRVLFSLPTGCENSLPLRTLRSWDLTFHCLHPVWACNSPRAWMSMPRTEAWPAAWRWLTSKRIGQPPSSASTSPKTLEDFIYLVDGES